MADASVNQIVKGKRSGVFVVLGLFTRGGERFAQLKAVNPANLAETARGELSLPLSCLKHYC